MKIIRQGNPRNEKTTRRFECNRCGCVFEMNEGEFRMIPVCMHDYLIVTTCPCCNEKVFSE